MADNSLRSKTFWGIVWSYIGKFGSQILSLVPAMILARLLGPSQYGLIAMAAVFTGIGYQLADAGFGNALIQKDNADNIDYSTVFFFNIGICGVIYAFLYYLSPFMAEFFHEPELISIIRVSSFGIIILAFGQIQTLIFKKEINYKSQVIRNLVCQVISAVVAIVMAYMGYGVWALVFQGLISTLGTVVINWFVSSWRPIMVFSFSRLKLLFGFGSKTLLSSLIDYGFNKMYDIVIGRVYSPEKLGLYNRANSTADLFKSTFFSVFSGVTFPLFVKMQNDDARLRMNVRKFLMVVTMIIFTTMGTCVVLSKPIFVFLYSSKWDGAIGLFCIASIVAMITPVVSVLESVILAKGHSGKFLKISILRKVFVVFVVSCVWKYGVMWLLIGQLIVSIIESILYVLVTHRLINYSLKDLLHDLAPSFAVASLVCVITYASDYVVSLLFAESGDLLLAFVRLLTGAIIASTSFIAINKICKTSAYQELLQFIEDSVGKKKIITMLKY